MTKKEQVLHNIFGFSPNRVDYLINISNKYKYIYFETPKVGCSTIKRTLQKLEVDNAFDIPIDVHNKVLSPLSSPLKMEKTFIEYLTDEYFKFSFVRNPYTRILSCYLDKIVGTQKELRLPKLGFDPTDNISFKDFLLAVKKQSYAEMDVHWKPQSILLAAKNITLDFIGRQENFDYDLQQVLSKITKKDSNSVQISNERPHAVGANEKLKKYMTQDIAKIIYDIYYDDFELYGYSKDPFDTEQLPEVIIKQQEQETDLVSIIIPCYNQAQYLEESVQSAIEQTYANTEIIIVNDGSSDNTQEVALKLQKKYPGKINILKQENCGLYAARNAGMKQASGLYTIPLDADDKIDNQTIIKCIQTMKEHNADIVYFGYRSFGVNVGTNKWRSFSDSYPLYQTPCSATALFKRKVWETIGGYKKNMSDGYEDWEFWINAYKHNFKFQHHPEVLLYYRTKEESMYTEAHKKDDYLKAKIVMNHPELYTGYRVQTSIERIKEVEGLNELYFLSSDRMSIDMVILRSIIDTYLANNEIGNKQYINIPTKKIKLALCSLDILTDIEDIEELITTLNVNEILFYSPLRYVLSPLTNLDFAWSKKKGIIESEGTAFNFTFKSERDNLQMQFTAQERLEDFANKKATEVTKQAIWGINVLQQLDEKKEYIVGQNSLMVNQEKILMEHKNKLMQLRVFINKLSAIKFFYHPIKKYKKYKNLLKLNKKLKG